MPKPMTMTIEVEEVAFGRVFRTLDAMAGVVAIKLKGEGPKKAKANGSGGAGQKHGGAQSVACIVLGALTDKILNRQELATTLEANGKKAASLPDTLMKLRKMGEIRSIGEGRDIKYKITTKGVKHFNTACAIQPAKG